MEPPITKEEFKQLISVSGKVRGSGPKNISDLVLKRKGMEGLKKLEKAITEAGYPIDYKDIKLMDFYPMGLAFITLLLSQRLFSFNDKDFQEMGKIDARVGPIKRLFMRFLISLDMAANEAPNMWRRYHTAGNLKVENLDKSKKTLLLRLENFKTIPSHLQYLIGYFSTVLQMIVGKETSCSIKPCQGNEEDCHKFLLKW